MKNRFYLLTFVAVTTIGIIAGCADSKTAPAFKSQADTQVSVSMDNQKEASLYVESESESEVTTVVSE